MNFKDGEPCDHPGCLHHITHPCEGCGRIAGRNPEMTDLEKEIHADAREALARQVYRAIVKQERSDIAIALILRALDEWYEKGFIHGQRNIK